MALLSSAIHRPRTDLPERVIQFGSGRLLRGFTDFFLHRANADPSCAWSGRVVVIQSTGGERSNAFGEQDGLFTVLTRGVRDGHEVDEHEVVSSVSRAISAQTEWRACLAVARQPEIELIVSNTTEVGIRHSADDRPDASPPESFPAKLAVMLRERFRALGGGPEFAPVVIPCELIENNGDALRSVVLALCDRWGWQGEFCDWVRDHVVFANSLVDRICTAPEDGAGTRLGYEDHLLTVVEPYRLWAVQGGEPMRSRLHWASADPGVFVADDIAPFRQRKVRILNGTHTAAAPAAFLAGHGLVVEMMRDPVTAAFVEGVALREIVPSLEAQGVEGAAEFAQQVFDRFRNPFLRHRLIDISLQCTSKVKVRLVPSIRAYHQATGELPRRLCLSLAAWLLFSRGVHQTRPAAGQPGQVMGELDGKQYPIQDEHAPKLMHHWSGIKPTDDHGVHALVHGVLSDRLLWSESLADVPGLEEAVAERVLRIARHGIRQSLEAEG